MRSVALRNFFFFYVTGLRAVAGFAGTGGPKIRELRLAKDLGKSRLFFLRLIDEFNAVASNRHSFEQVAAPTNATWAGHLDARPDGPLNQYTSICIVSRYSFRCCVMSSRALSFGSDAMSLST